MSERGGKYSPLNLGVISLLCDPLLIPSIIALSRGFSELREVDRREAGGHWSPEHREIRTGAVWGIALGGARPAVAVLLFAMVMTDVAFSDPDAVVERPLRFPDETVEVVDDVTGADEARRDVALAQVGEIGWQLDLEQRRRLLDWSASASIEPERRTRLVTQVIETDARRELMPDDLGPVSQLGPAARAAVFTHLLSPSLPSPRFAGALRVLGDMLARPDAFVPGAHALAASPLAPELFAALVERRDPNAVSLGAELCRRWEEIDASDLREAVLAGLGDPERASADHVDLARCLDGADVDRALVALAGRGGSLGVHALSLALDRHVRVSRSVVSRLALDPMTFEQVRDALDARDRGELLEARFRTRDHRVDMIARRRFRGTHRVERREHGPGQRCYVYAAADGEAGALCDHEEVDADPLVAAALLDEDRDALCARVCGDAAGGAAR